MFYFVIPEMYFLNKAILLLFYNFETANDIGMDNKCLVNVPSYV